MSTVLPFLKFYVNDWMRDIDVRSLSLEEQGLYINLICLAWTSDDCSIPKDLKLIGKLIGQDSRKIARLLRNISALIEEKSDRFVLKKLVGDFEKSREKKQSQSKIAKCRWTKQEACDGNALQNRIRTESEQNQNRTEQKKETSTTVEVKKEADDDVFSLKDLAALWNNVASEAGLPQVKTLTTSRLTHFKARQKKFPEALTEKFWRRILYVITQSDFLQGKNKSQWVANFDWLLSRDDVIAGLIEGKYDNRGQGGEYT